MRTLFKQIFCLALMLTISGCGTGVSGDAGSSSAGVDEVLEERAAEEDGKETGHVSGVNKDAPKPSQIEEKDVSSRSDDADVDLTNLSSTVVYSEVYNMMTVPKFYIGKTVKMRGVFARYHDEKTGKDYFSCIVQDAKACCSQGIEFVLKDEYKYPDNYPVEGTMITVLGTFDTYMEGEKVYCTLREASLID